MWDIIIIGAGICGCAAARELSRLDADILLLEASHDICTGASRANTAIVHAGYDAMPGSRKARFNREGNALYPKLCAQMRIPLERNGSLVIAQNEQEMQTLDLLMEKGRKNSIDGLEIWNMERVRREEPIAEDAIGALYAPSAGITNPYGLAYALCENALSNGIELQLNQRVREISRRHNGYAVYTQDRAYTARAIVNAAGVYSDAVCRMVYGFDAFSIQPRKGEYLIIDRKHQGKVRHTLFQTPQILPSGHTKGVLIAPTVDGTLLIGPTATPATPDDKATTREGFDFILGSARRIWRDLPQGDIIAAYAGLRAHSGLDDFIVGRAPDKWGFYLMAGIESPGITAAPAIAAHIAEIAAEDLSLQPKKDFKPERPHLLPFRNMTASDKQLAMRLNPAYRNIVCRCEQITEAEIRAALRGPIGATDVDGVKMRCRAGMGRCQGGFCQSRILDIIAEERGIQDTEINKSGDDSWIIARHLLDGVEDSADA